MQLYFSIQALAYGELSLDMIEYLEGKHVFQFGKKDHVVTESDCILFVLKYELFLHQQRVKYRLTNCPAYRQRLGVTFHIIVYSAAELQ